MFELAYGPLELKPHELWGLTLRELSYMAQGYTARVETARYRDAWMLSNLLSPYSKDRITPEQILGKEQPGGVSKITEEEYQRLLARKRRGAKKRA